MNRLREMFYVVQDHLSAAFLAVMVLYVHFRILRKWK